MGQLPVREGVQSVVPYLRVKGATSLVEFLGRALGAEPLLHAENEAHHELRLFDTVLMIGEVGDLQPSPVQFLVYVAEPEVLYLRACTAGGRPLLEPCDRPWGDGEALLRAAGFTDPTGNAWYLAGPRAVA